MKLSKFAKEIGVCYKTAWRYWHAGLLEGYQVPSTSTIIVTGFKKEVNENDKEKLKEEETKENGSN